MARILANNI